MSLFTILIPARLDVGHFTYRNKLCINLCFLDGTEQIMSMWLQTSHPTSVLRDKWYLLNGVTAARKQRREERHGPNISFKGLSLQS